VIGIVIAATAPVFLALVGAALSYGRLIQRVKDNGKRITRLENVFNGRTIKEQRDG